MAGLQAETVFKYWKAMKAIRANAQKADIESAVYPYLSKREDREKVQKGLSNSYKLNVSDGDYLKEKEQARILAERRNGKRKN